MAKITIEEDDGRELVIARGSHVYYREADQNDVFWQWDNLTGVHPRLEQILEQADNILKQMADILPDLPRSGTM